MIFIYSQSLINPSLTNLVQSRWLEISLVPFFAILWTLTLSLIELGKYSAMLTSCLVNNANIRETDLYHSKHANISTCSFAGSTSTNPTQCRMLNNNKMCQLANDCKCLVLKSFCHVFSLSVLKIDLCLLTYTRFHRKSLHYLYQKHLFYIFSGPKTK